MVGFFQMCLISELNLHVGFNFGNFPWIASQGGVSHCKYNALDRIPFMVLQVLMGRHHFQLGVDQEIIY